MQVDHKEEALIESIKQNKPEAFNMFYDLYAASFYGNVKTMLYKEQVSGEVLRQAFSIIWKSICEFDPSKDHLFTWSFKIVRKVAMQKKIDLSLEELFACRNLPPLPGGSQ